MSLRIEATLLKTPGSMGGGGAVPVLDDGIELEGVGGNAKSNVGYAFGLVNMPFISKELRLCRPWSRSLTFPPGTDILLGRLSPVEVENEGFDREGGSEERVAGSRLSASKDSSSSIGSCSHGPCSSRFRIRRKTSNSTYMIGTNVSPVFVATNT